MLMISLVMIMKLLMGGVKFISMVRLEFMFMMIIMMSSYYSMTMFLMVVMLSGVSSIIFMILYIKYF